MRQVKWLIIVLILCGGGIFLYIYKQVLIDAIHPPSAKEVYLRTLTGTERGKWDSLQTSSANSPYVITAPYTQLAYSNLENTFAATYHINASLGEQLLLNTGIQKSDWFIEIAVNGKVESTLDHLDSVVQYIPNKNGIIKVAIASKLNAVDTLNFQIAKQPIYKFPVDGKTNGAIKSFWGAVRDGGRRSHEGNDIFASRNTPVIAASDGRIARVADRGLGGKQVWLYDARMGVSHYYAHLEKWNIQQGDLVNAGDTIGFVGNTGNARTTPPHLHFGIYKNGLAIDPKPFIWSQPEPVETDPLPYSPFATGKNNAANLRRGQVHKNPYNFRYQKRHRQGHRPVRELVSGAA